MRFLRVSTVMLPLLVALSCDSGQIASPVDLDRHVASFSTVPDAPSFSTTVFASFLTGGGAVDLTAAEGGYAKPTVVKVVAEGFHTRIPFDNQPDVTGGPINFGPGGNAVVSWLNAQNVNFISILPGVSATRAESFILIPAQGRIYRVSRAGYGARPPIQGFGNPPIWCGGFHPACDYWEGQTSFSITPLASQLKVEADLTEVEPGTPVSFTWRADPVAVEGQTMPVIVDSTHWIPDGNETMAAMTANSTAAPPPPPPVHVPGVGAAVCNAGSGGGLCRRSVTESGTFRISAWVNGTRYEKEIHVEANADELVVTVSPDNVEVTPVLDEVFDAVEQQWRDPATEARIHDLVTLDVVATWQPSGRPAANAKLKFTVDVEPGSGFHPHDNDTRPKGQFFEFAGRPTVSDQKKGRGVPSELMMDADAEGRARIVYRTSGVSGIEKVTVLAAAEGDTDSKTSAVTIKLPGLVAMPRTGPTWTYSPQSGKHPGELNHYGDPAFIADVQALFAGYMQKKRGDPFIGSETKFIINELSLQWGGIFDFSKAWSNPHRRHRTGEDMDIRRKTLDEDQQSVFDEECTRMRFKIRCETHPNPPSGVTADPENPDHWHYHLRRPKA
jgi:hypothetical protein